MGYIITNISISFTNTALSRRTCYSKQQKGGDLCQAVHYRNGKVRTVILNKQIIHSNSFQIHWVMQVFKAMQNPQNQVSLHNVLIRNYNSWHTCLMSKPNWHFGTENFALHNINIKLNTDQFTLYNLCVHNGRGKQSFWNPKVYNMTSNPNTGP
jgi:hypothetical protein